MVHVLQPTEALTAHLMLAVGSLMATRANFLCGSSHERLADFWVRSL